MISTTPFGISILKHSNIIDRSKLIKPASIKNHAKTIFLIFSLLLIEDISLK